MANVFRIKKALKSYLDVDTKFMIDMERFGEVCNEYIEQLQLSKDMDLLAPETLDKLRDYLIYSNKVIKLNKEFKSILTKSQFYRYKRTIVKWLIDNKMIKSISKEKKDIPLINETNYLSLTFTLNDKPLQVHQVLDNDIASSLTQNGYNIDEIETQTFNESPLLSLEEVDKSMAHIAFFFVYYYGVRVERLKNKNWDRIASALDKNQNLKLKSLDIRAKQGNFTYTFDELADGRINKRSTIRYHCNVCGSEWNSTFKKLSCHCPACAMRKKKVKSEAKKNKSAI